MTDHLAFKLLKETASFHATGYHFLQSYKNGGKDGFLREHPELVFHGWFQSSDPNSQKHNDEWQKSDYGISSYKILIPSDP